MSHSIQEDLQRYHDLILPYAVDKPIELDMLVKPASVVENLRTNAYLTDPERHLFIYFNVPTFDFKRFSDQYQKDALLAFATEGAQLLMNRHYQHWVGSTRLDLKTKAMEVDRSETKTTRGVLVVEILNETFDINPNSEIVLQ